MRSRAVVLSPMLIGAAPVPVRLLLMLGGAAERISWLQCLKIPAPHTSKTNQVCCCLPLSHPIDPDPFCNWRLSLNFNS